MINLHLYPSNFLNESRIFREARSLRKQRYFEHIHLVGTMEHSLASCEQLEDGIAVRRLGFEKVARENPLTKMVRILSWTLKVFFEYRRLPLACINCHSVSSLPISVLLKRTTGAKLIYDAHELETETNGLGGWRKHITKWLERSLIREVDASVFVGKEIENWYRKEYGLACTAVVYNCPMSREVEKSSYFHSHFCISTEIPIFLYQGVLARGRGLEILMEAFREIEQHAVLVLMGYGPLEDWVKNRASETSNVYFHAAVPPDCLLEYTAAADYGVSVIEPTSLSYEYCMPNKLFEYLMARKPVLVSPTREQRDFVTAHDVGVVATDLTPVAVRDAVRRILSRKVSDFGPAISAARELFNWEKQEAVLKGVYDGLGFSSGESRSG